MCRTRQPIAAAATAPALQDAVFPQFQQNGFQEFVRQFLGAGNVVHPHWYPSLAVGKDH